MSGRPALMSPAICRAKTASDFAETCRSQPGSLISRLSPVFDLSVDLERRQPLRLELAGDGRFALAPRSCP